MFNGMFGKIQNGMCRLGMNGGIFARYRKIHSIGEPIYKGSIIPFFHGKKKK